MSDTRFPALIFSASDYPCGDFLWTLSRLVRLPQQQCRAATGQKAWSSRVWWTAHDYRLHTMMLPRRDRQGGRNMPAMSENTARLNAWMMAWLHDTLVSCSDRACTPRRRFSASDAAPRSLSTAAAMSASVACNFSGDCEATHHHRFQALHLIQHLR